MRAALAIAGLVVVASAVPGPLLAQPAVDAVVQRVHRAGGYPDQLKRSGSVSPNELRVGRGGSDADIRVPAPRGKGWNILPALALGGSVFQVVMIVLVVMLVAMLVLAVGYGLQARANRRDPGSVAPARPLGTPPPGSAEPTGPGDPDALAQQGRFREALAALLYLALCAVGWRPRRQSSLTAREVLASLATSDPRSHPLAQLVHAQEQVAFAGEAPSPAVYQSARTYYDAVCGQTHEG